MVATVATHIALAWLNMLHQDGDPDQPSTDRPWPAGFWSARVLATCVTRDRVAHQRRTQGI
jgi:hypothetical protein